MTMHAKGTGRAGSRAGRRSATVVCALLVAVASISCKGSAQVDKETAAKELQRLERMLAETADLHTHPVLTDGDLDPLRQAPLSDARVDRARAACVRQYEAIVQAQDDLARCKDLEDMLQARMHDLGADAADPALILAEAQDVCARAFRATDHIERARRECDDAVGNVRKALGLMR
jgi:hypothetical protein